tara:strand:- start:7132 stop:8241 length:1110 start_codon:yes stop_codon:yes gene_type:complete
MTQLRIKASFIRGGTSKGVFFHQKDLPDDINERNKIFLRILGSPDYNARQLDGLGGGISSLSKIVVVALSDEKDIDLDYTFGQVAVDSPIVDYIGNCGNLTSAVGPFAVDEGLLSVPDGEVSLRLRNTNTGKVIISHFRVEEGRAVVSGTYKLAGVQGTGYPIKLDFMSPAGSVSKEILPSTKALDFIEVEEIGTVEISLVDVSTACVFVSASSLNLDLFVNTHNLSEKIAFMDRLEDIRKIGAIKMGLSPKSLSIPKLIIIDSPKTYSLPDGTDIKKTDINLTSLALSMGKPHKAIPLTAAMCIATAAKIPGTIPNRLINLSRSNKNMVNIGHPSGIFFCEPNFKNGQLDYISVIRTQRRLMKGYAFY